jgi:hypothetical protein
MLSLEHLNPLLATLRAELQGLTALVQVIAGRGFIDSATLAALVAAGRIDPQLALELEAGHHPELVQDAFLSGLLFHRLLEAGQDATDWGEAEWHEELRRRPVTLDHAEREAMQWAAARAGIYCQGLANTLSDKTGELVVERLADDRSYALLGDDAQREASLEGLRTAVSEAAEGRKDSRWLRSRLLELMGDGTRNLTRIAQTESQRAHDMGVAADLAKRHGGDARVYKRPHRDACERCLGAYTEDGVVPRLFTLRELAANGDNFGRKAADWVATVGPMHPHCACPLRHLPAGFTFDETGAIVRAH